MRAPLSSKTSRNWTEASTNLNRHFRSRPLKQANQTHYEKVYLDRLTAVRDLNPATNNRPVWVFLEADPDINQRHVAPGARVRQQHQLRFLGSVLGYGIMKTPLTQDTPLLATRPVTVIIADNRSCEAPDTLRLPNNIVASRLPGSCHPRVPLVLYQADIKP